MGDHGRELDADLARRAQSGDRSAWEKIIELHTPKMIVAIMKARWKGPNAAEDAVQETWMSLFRSNLKGYEPHKGSLGPYLRRAAIFHQISADRKKSSGMSNIDPQEMQLAGATDGPLEEMIRNEDRAESESWEAQLVRRSAECWAQLNEEYQTVLRARFPDLPEPTVESLLTATELIALLGAHRDLKAVAELLDKDYTSIHGKCYRAAKALLECLGVRTSRESED